MPFQVSPGVNVSEIDLTTIVPAVSTTEGALAGVFRWGPVDDRELVSSEDELALRYGTPNANNFETFFTGANFLAYGNKLYVSRAASNAYNAIAGSNVVANTVSTVAVKNINDYNAQSSTIGANNDILYVAKYPGAMGSSLRISVCDSANAFHQTLTTTDANNTVNLAFTVGSNTATLTIVNSASDTGAASVTAVALLADITVGDYIVAGNNSIGTQFLRVSGKGNPASTNTDTVQATVSFDNIMTLAQNANTGSIQRYWEYYSVVDSAPGTTSFTASRGGSGDEMHIIVSDEDGSFTGTRGAILEVFAGVSRATNAEGEQGGSLYYKNVINNNSRYVWWVDDRAGSTSGVASAMTALDTSPLSLSFSGGLDGENESAIALASLARAYDQFKSAEDIDISLILQGKARAGVNDTGLANYLIDNIAEYRKDCVVFVSPRREAVVEVFAGAEENVVAFRNNLRSTSYGFLDSGYKYQYDKYNDVYRWVPLNGDIAGLAVRTDDLRDPWWSPAGFNRGHIKNVVKLAFNPDKARRDVLYKAGVNPVVTFPGQGTILYGDKTLLAKPSAFDRINVRRLFIVLEKAIATAAKYTLFEFNDEFTRAQFRNMVEPFLRDVHGRRGIYDFKVVCDNTNNTPEIIDRNEFVGDIYIKPARSINFIQLNFVAVRTGVEFEEVVGKF